MSEKAKHTQEKLVLSSSFLICTEEAKVIANFAPLLVDGLRVDVFEAIANAKRFIALWNACKGIPTEALEQGVVGEMLVALKNIENDNSHMPETAWQLIQNAITKAGAKK